MGCFRIEEIRDKYNERGLKEGGGIEMATTVLPYTRLHALHSLEILTAACNTILTEVLNVVSVTVDKASRIPARSNEALTLVLWSLDNAVSLLRSLKKESDVEPL